MKSEAAAIPEGLRGHKEIAEIMTERGYPMTREAAWQTEQRALRKLRDALEPYVEEMQPDAEISLL